MRDKSTGEAMPKDAIFRLYSMTKPFASVAAMMLMEDGKLLITDPVAKFLPQLAKREVVVSQVNPVTGKIDYLQVPTEREMTVQDLLRHTSGLVYGTFTPNPRIKELYEKNGVTWDGVTPEEQIERLAKVPLAHQPGTRGSTACPPTCSDASSRRSPAPRWASSSTSAWSAEDGRHELRGASASSAGSPSRWLWSRVPVSPSSSLTSRSLPRTTPVARAAPRPPATTRVSVRCCSTAASSTARAC